MSSPPGLIADIGGTNARFALVAPGEEPRHALVLPCAEFAGPAEAAEAYLSRVSPGERPRRAAFAVAAAVTGDFLDITNNAWKFSIEDTGRRLGLESFQVVNDFTAVALCVPLLEPRQRIRIGGGEPVAGVPIGVLGPGTGLGVSGLVPCGGNWHALATEGGHVTLPAASDREAAVIDWLRGLYDHVSAERVLSGPGLVTLYSTLCEIDGRAAEPHTPDIISARGLDGSCPACAEALAMFFAMLGTVAGNLVLTLGARGGVYLAGGVTQKLLPLLAASPFLAAFNAKAEHAGLVARMPVYVATDPEVGLRGAAAWACRSGP